MVKMLLQNGALAMASLFRRLLLLFFLFVLTKKLFNNPNSILSQPILANSQDLQITTTIVPVVRKIKRFIRPAVKYAVKHNTNQNLQDAQNEDILSKVEKLNAHIEELAYLLSLPETPKHLESMCNRINEIKKQAGNFHVTNLINYPQLQEIESKVLIFKQSES